MICAERSLRRVYSGLSSIHTCIVAVPSVSVSPSPNVRTATPARSAAFIAFAQCTVSSAGKQSQSSSTVISLINSANPPMWSACGWVLTILSTWVMPSCLNMFRMRCACPDVAQSISIVSPPQRRNAASQSRICGKMISSRSASSAKAKSADTSGALIRLMTVLSAPSPAAVPSSISTVSKSVAARLPNRFHHAIISYLPCRISIHSQQKRVHFPLDIPGYVC